MDFTMIWEEHKPHLLNFIKVRVGDKELSEDILQEVGLKFLESCSGSSPIKNPRTWLFQVTRNTIADHYRKHNQNIREVENNILSIPESGQSNVCPCDLTGFIIREYLDEKYGVPLYLSDIEQVPQKEIAAILNLELTTTKSRIQRGRKKLKDLLAKCVTIGYNKKGQIVDFQLKNNCDLPSELKHEMIRLNLNL